MERRCEGETRGEGGQELTDLGARRGGGRGATSDGAAANTEDSGFRSSRAFARVGLSTSETPGRPPFRRAGLGVGGPPHRHFGPATLGLSRQFGPRLDNDVGASSVLWERMGNLYGWLIGPVYIVKRV